MATWCLNVAKCWLIRLHTTSVPMNLKPGSLSCTSLSTRGIQCMEPQEESSMLRIWYLLIRAGRAARIVAV